MLINRYAKIVMSLCLAIFCLLVVSNNITDYGTNFLFVQHVLSMDTTHPGNALTYRAITAPAIWNLSYGLIIAAEAVTGVLFLAGAIRLWQERDASGAKFNAAKGPFVAGAIAAFLLWFLGFMVIAGEWFAMWQSQTWNGQEAAFRFYVTVLAVLIFVNQADGDLPESEPARVSMDKPAIADEDGPLKHYEDRVPQRRRTDKGRRHSDTR
jgi:predicted small integral membrane protein